MSSFESLKKAALILSQSVHQMSFGEPTKFVYNPLEYAWSIHEQYLKLAGQGKKKVVFLGMNPGPFGMAQTGVPFGEIAAVKNWMGLSGDVKKPSPEHPKREVVGLKCQKSEVSGRRLWGLFSEKFTKPEDFFEDHFVAKLLSACFYGGKREESDSR